MKPPIPARQRGIAMVLVLWAATLLTVIAASFVFSIRTDVVLAQNMVAGARAQALAEAGVQRALYETFKPATDKQRWKGDGIEREWEYGGAKITVVMQDVSGKIDINAASDLLLKGLLMSVGLDDARAGALLDAIVDWRDVDELRRPNGAEASDYQAAGLKYKPANAPFETVDELRRVLGMTPQIYARLADVLTVDSRQAGLNAVVASKNALMAIPNVEEAAVDAYIAARQQALETDQPLPQFAPAAPFMAGINGSVYSVRAKAVLPDGAVFVRETVARLNQGAVRKVAYLSWKEGEATQVKSYGGNFPIVDGK
jgi:general secretion pathway protein K